MIKCTMTVLKKLLMWSETHNLLIIINDGLMGIKESQNYVFVKKEWTLQPKHIKAQSSIMLWNLSAIKYSKIYHGLSRGPCTWSRGTNYPKMTRNQLSGFQELNHWDFILLVSFRRHFLFLTTSWRSLEQKEAKFSLKSMRLKIRG